jgi:diguanylate cyclase (GGDEF)-like protein
MTAATLVALASQSLVMWPVVVLQLAVVAAIYTFSEWVVQRVVRRSAGWSAGFFRFLRQAPWVTMVISLPMVVLFETYQAPALWLVVLFAVIGWVAACQATLLNQLKTLLMVGGVAALSLVWAMTAVTDPQGAALGGLLRLLETQVLLVLAVAVVVQSVAVVLTGLGSAVHHLERWQAMASTDLLTGIDNRRQFQARLRSEVSRAQRHDGPLSLAMIDVDNFKQINDLYGHPTGDAMLRELGALLRRNLRESDVAARYGGEEFALILPETRLFEAADVLERLRELVAYHVFCKDATINGVAPFTTTVSIGLAQLGPDILDAEGLIEKADAALYKAKTSGKNQVAFGVVMPPQLNDKITDPQTPQTALGDSQQALS